jgi:HSP20 family molecular chaperone IbpA
LFDPTPFRRGELAFRNLPAVDVAETDKAYEITAELPGLEERGIEVKLANDILSVRGEKHEERNKRIITGANVALARLSVAFRYQVTLRSTRFTPASKMASCQ